MEIGTLVIAAVMNEGINSWADRQNHRFFAGIAVAPVEEDGSAK